MQFFATAHCEKERRFRTGAKRPTRQGACRSNTLQQSTTGHSVPIVRPHWKRTFRRSNDERGPFCWRVRKQSRSATGLPAPPAAVGSPRSSRRLVRRVGNRECRRNPRNSAVRSVPIPFLDDDGLARGHLSGLIRSRQPEPTRESGGNKRSHLDLQIDLLAEREMTAVLQLLQDIARHLNVQTTVTHEQLRDLVAKTDLRCLTNRMEGLAEPATPAASTAADSNAKAPNAATS